MKSLKIMLLTAAFAVSSFAIAGTEPSTSQSRLSKEIKELLKDADFKIQEEVKAYVTFTLNDKDEIVVLSVDSDQAVVESFIKSRLNYKQITSKLDPKIKIYRMPVRVVKNL